MFFDRFMHGAITGGVLATILIIMIMGGCTSVKRSFLGYDSDQVWTAMVAVARTPAYDDWNVAANNVWVDEREYRIEVHRHLRRVQYGPDSDPERESQTWRFEIRLVELDPPLARFVSRGVGQPTDAYREGNRYFLDVHDLLLGVSTEPRLLNTDDDELESPAEPEPEPEPEPVEFNDPDDLVFLDGFPICLAAPGRYTVPPHQFH